MIIPRLLERVRIEGRDGLFLVTRVDPDQQIADVLSFKPLSLAEEGIPFALIHPVREAGAEKRLR